LFGTRIEACAGSLSISPVPKGEWTGYAAAEFRRVARDTGVQRKGIGSRTLKPVVSDPFANETAKVRGAGALTRTDFHLSLQCHSWVSSLRGGLGLVEMTPDGFGGFAGDYGGQGLGGGLLHVAEAAEVGEQALAGLRAYAGDV